MERLGLVADWRDGRAYTPLLDADRSLFAWEWLRRDPAYLSATVAARAGRDEAVAVLAWGLHRFEDPALGCPKARPIWRKQQYPYVLEASAGTPGQTDDALDLSHLSGLATMAADDGGEHWLLSDGLRAIRVDLRNGTLHDGPTELRYHIAGRASARQPLLTLRRLLALADARRFSTGLHARETKARRWILALRVHDALAAGANQREIAVVLFGETAKEARWRLHAASVRSQVQRLARQARKLASGAYRDWLH